MKLIKAIRKKGQSNKGTQAQRNGAKTLCAFAPLRLCSAILAALAAIVLPVDSAFGGCEGVVCRGYLTLEAEIPTIRKAAERNSVKYGSDDWFILLAIRKAENGRSGCEFGVKHTEAWDTNLDTQAGWAAATVVKNRVRWVERGRPCYDYIEFLANRYVPVECDEEGNANWKRNVRYWFEKFKSAEGGPKERQGSVTESKQGTDGQEWSQCT